MQLHIYVVLVLLMINSELFNCSYLYIVLDHLRHATSVMKMVRIVQCRHPVVQVWSMQTLFFMSRPANPGDVPGHSLDLAVLVSMNCSWTGQNELCMY